jgi:hypothetical protein
VFLVIAFMTANVVCASTIALVSSRPEIAALVDILSVPLSPMTNITLAERAEIQRVLRAALSVLLLPHGRPNPVFPGEQPVESFRKKILKWGRASAVITGSKPEAWRSSVPHDQVVVSKLRKNCVVKS